MPTIYSYLAFGVFFLGGGGGGSGGGWLMKPELIISVTDKLQTRLSGSFAVRPLKFS